MDHCSKNPCLNGGTCQLSNFLKAGYVCICQDKFTGDNCQCERRSFLIKFFHKNFLNNFLQILDSKACSGNRCLNGGTCFSDASGEYMCSCASGWNGTTCENNQSNLLSRCFRTVNSFFQIFFRFRTVCTNFHRAFRPYFSFASVAKRKFSQFFERQYN
jgi:hypothetical protein